MTKHDRFANVFEAVTYLVEELGYSQQDATHYVWSEQYKVGTDRGVWMPLPTRKAL